MRRRILDTDIVSLILRGDERLRQPVETYLRRFPCFTTGLINCFELLRGLRFRDAHRRLRQFEQFVHGNEILPVDWAVIDLAADIYADLRRQGELLPDADILIAATALANDCVLVTGNEKHFQRISDLEVENWLA
ncbi:MAG: type II toxin-antitoxin system VapC family toxin [Chloroflexi bacterium]|nr:type II toxin-antitoxin system VapC family toxin [Chloroflexota bacterium]